MQDIEQKIPQINHESLKTMIKRSYTTKIPIFIWGTFGIGKSYSARKIAEEIAKDENLKYSENKEDYNKEDTFVMRTIPLHQWDISELKGIPWNDSKNGKTVFLPTDELPTSGKGILFFDELALAPPMVQANAYQIIHDRRLGSYKLPDGYLVIAASNTAQDRAHVFDMAMPLKNRFKHFGLKVPSVEEWVKDFAIRENIDIRIINFLKFQDHSLFKYDSNDVSDDVTAIATPRTWEFASKSIKDIDNDMELLEYEIGSCVGSPIANEFISFLKLSKSYDIAAIYKTGEFDVPTEIDQIYALITASISYYTKNNTESNAAIALDIATKFQAEHTIMMLSQLKMVDTDYFKKLKSKSNATKWKKAVEEYIKFLL